MFDESNASGMLMNNLVIAPNHMLTLESSLLTKTEFIKGEVEAFKANKYNYK